MKNGSRVRNWQCGRTDGNISAQDEILKEIVCGVLVLDAFAEELMDMALEKSQWIERQYIPTSLTVAL